MAEAIRKTLTARKVVLSLAGLFFLAVAGLWLADPDAFPPFGSFTEAQQPDPAAPVDGGNTATSAAEVITRLNRSVEAQRKYLEKLTAQLEDPNNEYHRSEKRFQLVTAERDSARRASAELKAAGKADEAAAREPAVKESEARWQRNRDRFNLAIQQRKEMQESILARGLSAASVGCSWLSERITPARKNSTRTATDETRIKHG